MYNFGVQEFINITKYITGGTLKMFEIKRINLVYHKCFH